MNIASVSSTEVGGFVSLHYIRDLLLVGCLIPATQIAQILMLDIG